jgi:hypothetical protein
MEARHAGESHMDMDMGGDTSSSGSGMAMMMSVFQTQLATPLYSTAWTPSNAGTYAATCIFLIVLAALLRGILALKAVQEARWLDAELKRRYVVVNGKQPMAEQLSCDSLAQQVVLSENGVEENVTVVQRKRLVHRPWRLSIDPIRAAMDVLIAGIGYLL